MRKKTLADIGRIVIKVGTSVIADKDSHKIDEAKIKIIAEDISALIDQGKQVILVSSGAIGAGMGVLKLKARPKELSQLQAVASIGQSQLMKMYEKFFSLSGIITAQILMTQEDFNDRRRYINARRTLETLMSMRGKKIVPVVNENDTVSTDEIKFGDNDRLSALVSDLVKADLLIILSDVEGYCKVRPLPGKAAEIISCIKEFTPEIEMCAADTLNATSIGGMKSKKDAAKITMKLGIPMIIAKGGQKGILARLIKGEEIGTFILSPGKEKLKAKKRWIAFTTKVKGKIMVDQGAKSALVLQNKSLLASGIIGKEGNFSKSDTVSIIDHKGNEFARGLVNYSSAEIEKIKGLKTNQIKEIAGFHTYGEAVHRDNLVIL